MHRSAAYEGIPLVSATSTQGTRMTLQTAAMITTSPSPKLACTQDQSNDDDIARPKKARDSNDDDIAEAEGLATLKR